MSARRPDDESANAWSPVTRSGAGVSEWSDVTRSDDHWSDDPAGWAMPMVCARHLRRAGAWMGAVAALGGALAAVVLVVGVWLLQAASSGSPSSAMRAGLLLILAAQHGGITLDGDTVRFLPLGLLALAAVLPWRAGRALAAVADDRGERAGLRRAFVGLVLGYVAGCVVLAVVGRVGSSHAQFLTTAGAAALLATVAGGAGVRRELCLRDETSWLPHRFQPVGRAVAAATLVTTTSAALLIAVSIGLHAGRVADLSKAVGGGFAGLPLLLIGILAAPNAVLATSSLLTGPGFAVGTDTVVTLGGSHHGLLPAVPLLGALPDGAGVRPLLVVWAAVTFVGVGLAVAHALGRAPTLRSAVRRLVGTALVSAGAMAVLALLAGGGLGTGRLRAIGASPWQAGLAFGGEVLVAGGLAAIVRATAALVRVADVELAPSARAVDVAGRDEVIDDVDEMDDVEVIDGVDDAEADDADDADDADEAVAVMAEVDDDADDPDDLGDLDDAEHLDDTDLARGA